MCFYVSWQNFANIDPPPNLTTIVRSASKFCARSRSPSPDFFHQGLIQTTNTNDATSRVCTLQLMICAWVCTDTVTEFVRK